MKRPRPPQPYPIDPGDRCASPRLRSEARRSCAPAPRLWVDDITQAIAKQIEAEHRKEYGKARKNREPRCGCDLVARLGQHAAPAWERRADSEAKERKRGF